MKKKTEIIITGRPVAKARPRFYRRGNHVGTYNDQTTEEGRWMLQASGQIKEIVPEGTPITLRCLFCMPIPKSMSKKQREATIYHIKRPDLDNLVKFVKDCLNGLAWRDDSQVSELFAGKVYSDEPRTEIWIEYDE